jgi:hypothetical protein
MILKAIPYQNETHEVTGGQFLEWEDRLEGIVGETPDERNQYFEWITYDYLQNHLGFFVKKPKFPDPRKQVKLEPLVDGKKEAKAKSRPEPLLAPVAPFGKNDWPLSNEGRPDFWTQEKVLREAERNLKTREELMERELQLRLKQASQKRIPKHIGGYDFKIYNKDGSELSILDMVKFFLMFAFIVGIVAAVGC